MATSKAAGRRIPVVLFLGVAIYALTLALYFVSRYDEQWTETDTTTITQSITALQAEGVLVPRASAYQHGYLYQATSTVILSLTGLSATQLQSLVYPFISVLGVVICGLTFYSLVGGDFRLAALSTLLLLLQPDVLFVLLRGSHEKLDWPLMMTALSLLYLSLGRSSRRQLVFLLLFYLVVFAQIATNAFFASTFLAATSLGLLLGVGMQWAMQRRFRLPGGSLRRLLYVSLSGGILLYLSMVYVYPLALANLRLLRSIVEQVSALFLSFEVASQPYEYISFGWISQPVYFGLTAFTWLLIAVSMAVWVGRGVRIFTGREPLGLQYNLDWLLYAGFALQVAASIVVDFSGALSSNLQLRVFPGFTVLASALLARAVWQLAGRLRFPGREALLAAALLGLLAGWFGVAALLKASNEPGLSNKWTFYATDEVAAVEWANRRLEDTVLWTGIDERIRVGYSFTHTGQPAPGIQLVATTFKDTYPYALISVREQLRAVRVGTSMPAVLDWLRLYDNGNVQLYHKRPMTPFQP
jgi:hypothetical protein